MKRHIPQNDSAPVLFRGGACRRSTGRFIVSVCLAPPAVTLAVRMCNRIVHSYSLAEGQGGAHHRTPQTYAFGYGPLVAAGQMPPRGPVPFRACCS